MRSHRTFLACCRQCRNPSCSRKCRSVSFLGRLISVASVLGHHCDLRDVRHAVLRVSGVVSIFDCFQSAKLQKNCSIPTRAAVFPRVNVGDLLGGTLHQHYCLLKALDIEVFIMMSATVALSVFRISISFCKNAGFLAISFSMVEITSEVCP